MLEILFWRWVAGIPRWDCILGDQLQGFLGVFLRPGGHGGQLIPLQAVVLLVGVLVFVYYLFVTPPLWWNPAHARAVERAAPTEFVELEREHQAAWALRSRLAAAIANTPRGTDSVARVQFRTSEADLQAVRGRALETARRATGENPRDVNYVIPWFVLHELPLGLAGLFIAAVMAAAMSATAGELSALSTATVIDFYKRWFRREELEAHYLTVSRLATAVWGLAACGVAIYAASLGTLIEVVNRFGSFFYGSILGAFLLAMIPRARATGAFVGLIAGMSVVAAVSFGAPAVSFLWHNVIGAVTVVAVGMAVSTALPARPK